MKNQLGYTRRVWADLSKHPNASIREICARTGVHREAAQRAIYDLENCGYIDRTPTAARGRRIYVPLITEFTIHEREAA